jgi:hypothetical protein
MPLLLPSLQSGLQAVFAAPEATAAACAQKWADAVKTYAAGVVPASTAVTAAATALSTSLASAFASLEDPYGIDAMETAFTTFGAAVGAGMAGFVAVPPPGPVGFAAQFATHPATHAAAATAIAGKINTWMKTGTAAPVAGGPPANWS